MISKLILLISTIFLLLSCEDFFCDNENPEDTLRFKPLEEPIEGKLYFVAGPTTTEIDSFYNRMPWNFWKLEGTNFTKLNESPWPYNYSGRWNFQWSPNANYFSFFDDKGGSISNTDEIGLLNLTNFVEYYFTDSLGDANPSDQWIYKWGPTEEYIYFNSIQYGISEYDTLANSDLYRVTPNNYLEQLTDTPFFEAGVSPGPNGKFLAYVIEKRGATPETQVGIHILDLESMQSRMIIDKNEYVFQDINIWDIKWHPVADYLFVDIWHQNDHNIILKVDINTSQYEFIDFEEFDYYHDFIFVPNSSKIILFGSSEDQNYNWENKILVYDSDSQEILDLSNEIDLDVTVGFGMPTISPSGRYMAFVDSYSESPWYPSTWGMFNQNVEIYIMDLNDFSITQITHGLYGYEGHLKWFE